MSALNPAVLSLTLALAGCECGPPSGSSDASFDAIPCDMRTPEESATGINYSDMAALWPGTRLFRVRSVVTGIPLQTATCSQEERHLTSLPCAFLPAGASRVS